MCHARSQAGFVLVSILLFLALLMVLAVALNTSVITDAGLSAAYSRATAGFYAAESGLDVGMDKFRNEFLNAQLPSSSDFTPQTVPTPIPTPTTGTTPGKTPPTPLPTSPRTVSYQLQDPGENPQIVAVPAGYAFAGLNSIQYTYTVNSQSLNGGVTEASVGAQFNIENIPLFQFLAFYNGDLEILPGANMTLHGRIHTNGDLYLNADGATLTITTNTPIPIVKVTAKGNIHRGRKDTTECAGTVQVMTTGATPTPSLKTLSCIGTTSAVVPTPTLAAWGGSMVSGVSNISVPTPGFFTLPTPGATPGQFWLSADLRIALQLNANGGPHSIVVLNPDLTTNTSLTSTLTSFINDASFNMKWSNYPGTKPIFITDVPLATPGPGCNCNLNTWPPTVCSARQQNCYWGTPVPTFTPTFTLTPTVNRTTTKTLPPTATPTFTPTPYTRTPTPTPTFDNTHSFYNLDRIYSTNTWATLPTPTPSYAATPAALGSMFNDMDPRRGGFYNWREKTWMYLLNVNLRDLLQWNINYKTTYGTYAFFDPTVAAASTSDPTHTAKNGPVVFFTVLGANSNTQNNYGVRIFGSSPLPFPSPAASGDPTGITVVSDQAVYVAGDYNVAGTYTIGGTAASYAEQPAAMIGDSINVLSNSALPTPNPTPNNCTNDCQSILTLGSRTASNTNINAAFIGGVDVTTANNYNGGFENYPRFHESWSGDTLTYLGSYVSLGTPSHVDGIWCGTGGVSGPSPTPTPGTGNCNIYNPPTRAWDFDSSFNNVKYLPPMTPTFVYLQEVVFTENFN